MKKMKHYIEALLQKKPILTTIGNKDNYYTEAKDWYAEKYELVEVSRNRYRFLSFGLGVLLALSLFSFASIMPLKQYVYRLVEVNRQTGEVTSLKELEGNQYSSNWIINRYFLHQYVINRHLYSYEDIKRTFNLALAMSAKPIADEY